MKIFTSIRLSVLFLVIFSCSRDFSVSDQNSPTRVRPLSSQEAVIVDSDTDFSFELFKKISAADSDSNVFISPLSVSTALGMALNGASAQTYTDMLRTINLEALSEEERNLAFKTLHELLSGIDKQVLFEIANSIWYRNDFAILSEFVQTNQKYFFAEVASMNFAAPSAVDIINDWVNEKTHGKIEKILDAIPEDAVLYIINAIYFKATWLYAFDKAFTKLEPFYVSPQTSYETAMMKTTAELKYFQDASVQVVDLPYGQGNFSMTVFLPTDANAIDDFIANLNSENWNGYLNQMQLKKGTVSFPKLKLEYKLLLNDVLKEMGMSIAFSDGADFSRIRSIGGIAISRVIHKTFVQVDEEGTEAAAVTLIELYETSVGGHSDLDFYMQLNHPFIFVIHEIETGAILFMGKIEQPSWQD